MITLTLLLASSSMFTRIALAEEPPAQPATAPSATAPAAAGQPADPAPGAPSQPAVGVPTAPPVGIPAEPRAASTDSIASTDPPVDPRFGLELAIGNQGTSDSSFDPDGVRTTVGLTGRYQLTRALAIDLGLTHSYDGGRRGFYDENTTVEESYVSTTLLTERLDLGLRGELPMWKSFRPFAKVAAVGAFNVARLDEDTEDPQNPTQLSRAGVTGGGYLAAGISTPIQLKQQIHIVPSLELGYSLLAPLSLGDIGSLTQSGVTFRFSSGISF